eukprot:scaffold1051_cov119-Cylindrotheca_fusiformis.AAC.6
MQWRQLGRPYTAPRKSETKDDGDVRKTNDEQEDYYYNDWEWTDIKRRVLVLSSVMTTLGATAAASPPSVVQASNVVGEQSISVPLKFVGGSYLVYYRVEANVFRAVLDTGSPFLMIPGSCSANTRAKAGCYREQGIPSGLDTTVEIFDGFEGEVEWRKAPFAFVNATGSMIVPSPEFIFGVADDGIMNGPGGVFFGLIKKTDAKIRPSFLGQTDVTSFTIDLRNTESDQLLAAESSAEATAATTVDAISSEGPQSVFPSSPSLTLSTTPQLASSDYIPMTADLRKTYGDPVGHYVCKASSITIDGRSLIPKNRKPVYVIFDTGVTGMIISKDLFDQRYEEARQRREKRLWGGTVEVSFQTKQKKTQTITAQKPLTTSFDPKVNWTNFNAHILVAGLSFLDFKKLVVDIDDQRLWIQQ